MSRIKVVFEFVVKASPTILFHFLTEPACLVRWFCDAVDIQNDYYVFSWSGSSEVAEVVDDIEDERIKFLWDNANKGEFLEFYIYKSDVTDETILRITDFCDDDEEKDQRLLWESQIFTLKKEMGG